MACRTRRRAARQFEVSASAAIKLVRRVRELVPQLPVEGFVVTILRYDAAGRAAP